MEPKEKILKRASELFLSLGIRNVTMDSLASDLSISKRTIYEIFKDKDDLVIACIRYILTEDNKTLLGIIAGTSNVIEALVTIIRHEKSRRAQFPAEFVEDVKKYFPMVQAQFFSCKADLKQFSASYRLLEKGMEEGIFRSDLWIEMVDHYIHEMVSLVHHSERLASLKAQDTDYLHNIALPYFRGLCTPKGLELMSQFFDQSPDLSSQKKR